MVNLSFDLERPEATQKAQVCRTRWRWLSAVVGAKNTRADPNRAGEAGRKVEEPKTKEYPDRNINEAM
jgi:hypothetical protein